MQDQKNILLMSLPFAGVAIPSIQLATLESYLKNHNVEICTKNLYLKAAEIYGLKNYMELITPPNDSYQAQFIFSKYVFPEHFSKNKNHFKKYFSKNIKLKEKEFTFDRYIQLSDQFYQGIIKNINWDDFDIIGFTINYGQFLPSLAIAKKIKSVNPKIKIIFGGSRVVDTIGINVLKTFDYIDFIVSGDGEDALYLLATGKEDYQSIPRLIYRKKNIIGWNKSNNSFELNSLPLINYDSFFKELATCSEEVKQFFLFHGRLPIEISRGCWWNKCSFCNLNIQHKRYRAKNAERIIEEILFLSDRYKFLKFQFIGNTLHKNNYKKLLERIKNLNRDFSFFVEIRADQLKREDYQLLKQAGFNEIQVGVEAFSQNYLKKINKGVRVIDNIASLKFCKENQIKNGYNLIIGYPNEDKIDFKETLENIEKFKQYLDPPELSKLTVGFGSEIYNHPEKYNISSLKYSDLDQIMFPKKVLENNISFFYNYEVKKSYCKHNWIEIINTWKNESQKKSNQNDFTFYFLDGGNFIKIIDKRQIENIRIFILDELERLIFLSCLDIKSIEEIKKYFSTIPANQIQLILDSLVEKNIMLKDEQFYLSLPLGLKKEYIIDQEKLTEQVIQISGKKVSL